MGAWSNTSMVEFVGIPSGSTLSVTPMGILGFSIWELMGYIDTNTFVTIAQFPISQLSNPAFNQGQIAGSFSFKAPNARMRLYDLQVPFTFTTSSTYPTNLMSTDTTWVANVIPTDKVLEIENYTFPFILTPTETVNPSALNSTISYNIIPSGTIQQDYQEGVLHLYDIDRINSIKANNQLDFQILLM